MAREVKFISEGTQPKIYLLDRSKIALTYGQITNGTAQVDQLVRIDVRPIGPNANEVQPSGLRQRDFVKHFWLEHTMPDPILSVSGYGWIKYPSIYPGIDWHWYGGSGGTKMAFVCQPGSNPGNLELQVSGQDSLKIDTEGALKVYMNSKFLKFEEARAYQYDQFGSISFLNWSASYQIVDGETRVKMNYANYNPALPLVFFIGPGPIPMGGGGDNIPYSTYFGGSLRDEINEIAIAANGDYYGVGDIEDYSFPSDVGLTPNSTVVQTGMIAKFNSSYVMEWVGYYGNKLRTIALDEVNQRVILAGLPSNNLYTQQYGNGYISSGSSPNAGGSLAMISMTAAGIPPQMLWSTRWKSAYINKVLVDSNGRIYVAGSAGSNLVTQPGPSVVNPYFKSTNQGGFTDGFVSCFDSGTNLVWSTYYGGGHSDNVLDMDLDENSNRLVIVGRSKSDSDPFAVGCTVSNNWLPHCGGLFSQENCNGNGANCGVSADGFIAMFTTDLTWNWSTRFGGSSDDYISSVAFSPFGELYVAGYIGGALNYASSTCSPVSPGNLGFPHCVWQPNSDQADFGGLSEHFVAKFNTQRALVWSRFVGGNGYEFVSSVAEGAQDYPMSGPAITVDGQGSLYVLGSTTSGGASTNSTHVYSIQDPQLYYASSSNAQYELPERSEAYLLKFNSVGNPVHGTYYGGRFGIPLNQPGASLDQDIPTCIAVRDSRVFIGGTTASIQFFPIGATDGVPNSFLSSTPPLNQEEGATDLTNGFIAQLSFLSTSVADLEPSESAYSLSASFDENGVLVLTGYLSSVGEKVVVDLYDAQGRLILSDNAYSSGTTLSLNSPVLRSGVYVGRIQKTNYFFRVIRD